MYITEQQQWPTRELLRASVVSGASTESLASSPGSTERGLGTRLLSESYRRNIIARFGNKFGPKVHVFYY